MRYTILRLSVPLWLAVVSVAADAAKPAVKGDLPEPYRNKPVADGATLWYCAYSGRSSIRCALAVAGDPTATPAAALDPQLPAVSRQILEAPASLAGRIVEIPLFAPPFAFDLVGQLAESVMCGKGTACGILFGENPAHLAQLVRRHEAGVLARRSATVLASAAEAY